jgi:hypothetical protein
MFSNIPIVELVDIVAVPNCRHASSALLRGTPMTTLTDVFNQPLSQMINNSTLTTSTPQKISKQKRK